MTPTAEQAAQRITEALEKGPTEGPWSWWTSCSFRRLSSDATGKDGDVLYGVVQRHDNHGDIQATQATMDFIAAANPAALRALMAERAEWSDRTTEAQAERDAAREERDELLKENTRLQMEFDKRLRVSISQGDVIANHVIAMQSAVLERYMGDGSESAMAWIHNTLAGPGFLPSIEEAEAIPDPDAEGIAQAWFNAKTAEHEAFRAANPGPAALTTKDTQ